MGEFELIDRFFTRAPGIGPQRARLGVGDDCALLDVGGTLAITTDLLVEGRHFLPGADPEALGHKSLAVNLSDLAAMGAEPLGYTLAIALPHERARDEAWLAAFARGMFALGDAHDCALVGGDTTAGPLVIDITALGRVDAALALRRAAAQVGDDVYVSGELGAAALALRALRGEVELDAPTFSAARARLDRPTPRVALGRALLGVAHAAIDLSDGLAGDLLHIVQASGVGAEVELGALPLAAGLAAQPRALQRECALAGGDDYELCFTAAPAQAGAVERAAQAAGVRVTRIGRIVAGAGIAWREHGRTMTLALRGYDHFA